MSAWMRPLVMVRNAIMVPSTIKTQFRKSIWKPQRKQGFLSRLFSTLTEHETHFYIDENTTDKVLSEIKPPVSNKVVDEYDESIVAPFKSSSSSVSSSGSTLPTPTTPVPRLLTKPTPTTTTSNGQPQPQPQPQPLPPTGSESKTDNITDTSSTPSTSSSSFRVTIVDTPAKALEVLKRMNDPLICPPETTLWACDTEVADIELKVEGPVGNGKATCVSIYGGPHVDFGDGQGKGSILWIENIGQADGVLTLFKEWFENTTYRKIWHNYGFDRHIMNNEGIDVQGFHGDTMHMARLWNTARDKINKNGTGYSLEALSTDLVDDPRLVKVSMKELFGVGQKKKDGTEGLKKDIPPIRELQENPVYRDKWITYSCKDAIATWLLHDRLVKELTAQDWEVVREKQTLRFGTMYDFYRLYLCRFGALLTDMEAHGIRVDETHLHAAEVRAREEREKMQSLFLEWAALFSADAAHINTASSAQIGMLLFGEWENGKRIATEKTFKIDKDDEEYKQEHTAVLLENPYAKHTSTALKELLKARGLKRSGNKPELIARLMDADAADRAAENAAAGIETTTEGGVIEGIPEETVASATGMSIEDSHTVTDDMQQQRQQQQQQQIEAPSSSEPPPPPSPSSSEPPPPPSSSSETSAGGQVNYRETKITWLREFCLTRSIPFDPKAKRGVLIELLEEADGMFAMEQAYNPDGTPSLEEINKRRIEADYLAARQKLATSAKKTPEASAASLLSAQIAPPKKFKEITIKSLEFAPTDFTPKGTPQVSTAVLRKLAGNNPLADDPKDEVLGTAYETMGSGETGRHACRAIGALANVGQIDSTITNFLVPLQGLKDKNNRVHCSLNLNTETGRLSSRRPNLQNQPALEKDQYKIRDAFIAEEGKTLIVADYGQLELRILASITNCRSMIDAFKAGGCFHSRTAVGMYPHVRAAVDNGEVLLEWDYSKGQPTVPLVKDTYASERRKAKTLNFSIAYGKTVHGLAMDWGISKEEAQDTLDKWYGDRQEVMEWQNTQRQMAMKKGYVRTIMGRKRDLPDAKGRGPAAGHALRAAINTPIQGSAADIVMMAMIKLWRSPVLKELGWKLLLQIHDEVILEGPKESKDLAMTEVRECMENPYDDVLTPLKVHLDVDAKCADSWYKAK